MTIARLHETYLQDTETGVDARIASLSGSHVAEPYRLQRGVTAPAYDLGFERPRPVSLSQLPRAFQLALIDWEDPDRAVAPGEWSALLNSRDNSKFYRFAEYVSFANVIPYEASPVDLTSLASIAATASPMGIGAVVAFAVFGSSPLLLLGVPAAMIVCGAAAGVSRALDEGLRRRMLEFLTVRQRDDIALGEDVLEARRTEEALRQAKERLRQDATDTQVNAAEQVPEMQEQPARAQEEQGTQSEAQDSHGIGAEPAHQMRSEQTQEQRQQAAGD